MFILVVFLGLFILLSYFMFGRMFEKVCSQYSIISTIIHIKNILIFSIEEIYNSIFIWALPCRMTTFISDAIQFYSEMKHRKYLIQLTIKQQKSERMHFFFFERFLFMISLTSRERKRKRGRERRQERVWRFCIECFRVWTVLSYGTPPTIEFNTGKREKKISYDRPQWFLKRCPFFNIRNQTSLYL